MYVTGFRNTPVTYNYNHLEIHNTIILSVRSQGDLKLQAGSLSHTYRSIAMYSKSITHSTMNC